MARCCEKHKLGSNLLGKYIEEHPEKALGALTPAPYAEKVRCSWTLNHPATQSVGRWFQATGPVEKEMGISTARRLAEATSCWLHHEYLCQRAGLFDESALKSVVGQVLSSFVLDKPARAWSGIHHPVLLKYAARGSKAKLDFALAELAGSSIGKLRVILECKWADSKHCSSENIIYDLFRLAILDRYLKTQGHPAECVFLLAGTKAGVKKALAGPPFVGRRHISLRQGASSKVNRDIFDSSRHGDWASAFDAKATEAARKSVVDLGFPSITTMFNPGLPAISLGSDSINDQFLKFGCLTWKVEGF